MPRKKASRSFQAAQKDVTATYPSLHQDVVNVLDNFPGPVPSFNHGASSDITKEYDTNIMGRFECRNPGCSSPGWGSKMIGIQIRMFRDNTYDAVVFKQRCRKCQNLGVMRIGENSYIERVAYRLQKWAGVAMDRPEYNGMEGGPPHRSSLCEACRAGCCKVLKTQGI